MKILVIHTRYRQKGGECIAAQQEIELLKKNFTVEALFFNNNKGIAGMLQFLISIWNLKSAKIVKQKIKTFKPDVVHIHNWHFASGPIIIRTIKKQGIPLVLTLHNYRLLCPSSTFMHNNKVYLNSLNKNFPWEAISLKVYRNSYFLTFWLAFIIWFHKKIGTWNLVDQYICLTEYSVALFKNSKLGIDNKRFVVKPNFTTISTTKVTKERENHFLYIGRLSEEKGINILLDTFKYSNYELKIIGDGPLVNNVNQACKENDKITYLGTLTQDEVAIELQKAKALVFPSVCLETFGFTIIEAFSNRCIVVSSNIGAPASIVSDAINGFHFEAGNIKDLALKLKKVVSLTQKEEDYMREQAFESYSNLYSPEKQFNYFNAIYKEAKAEKHYN
uniref:glycosyltransferase n=1 Tax=Gelidibacter sp. TaxID=2018083 RepID=UPI004049666C